MKGVFGQFIMAVMGLIIVIFASTGILGIIGVMLGMMGGLLMFMSVFTLIAVINKEGIWPYFIKLKKNDEIGEILTLEGDTILTVVQNKKEGVLYSDGKFFADKKGQTVRTRSGKRKNFIIAGIGMTQHPVVNAYFTLLKKKEHIPTYDEAIKKYLGPKNWELFKTKFRDKKTVPSKYTIDKELTFLIDETPAEVLKEKIAGESFDFKDALTYMKYAYDTNATENAIEREKLDVLMRKDSYFQAQKAIGYAIAFIIVAIGIGVAFYIFQGVDFGSLMGLGG